MHVQTDSKPARRATNLSLDRELLQEAKSLGINVSRSAEIGIAAAVNQFKREKWLQENVAAIESSNEYVDDHGLPLSRFRNF